MITWTGTSNSENFDLTGYEDSEGVIKNFGFSDSYGCAADDAKGADNILISSVDADTLKKFTIDGNNVVYNGKITLQGSQNDSGDLYLWAGTSYESSLLYKATSNGLVEADDINPVQTNDGGDVIKNLIAYLDKTYLTGEAALDAAVQSCSNFSSWQDLVNSFIADCASYNGDAGKFLQEKCSIRLYNKDTGAISGYDAGSGVVKTAESVVPEDTSTFVYPTSATSTFDGLTVKWPTSSYLTSAQKTVIAGLNTWWIPNSLQLIKDTYGLSFADSNPSVKTITVNFVNNNSNTLATASYTYSPLTGKANSLALNINMKHYNSISDSDPNGVSSDTTFYADRTIAHELTHSIMEATINHFASLPSYFVEGMAELTHGIDDERRSIIANLAEDSSKLADVLEADVYDSNTNLYAAGYMLLRYLAYQASEPLPITLPSGDTVPADTKVLTVTENNGLLSSTGTEAVVLVASGLGDTLDGGVNNTNDTLLSAVSGSNTTFFLHKNGGDDIVLNFVFGGDRDTDDVIALDGSFVNSNLIIAGSGVVKIGSDNEGSITLKGSAKQNKFAYNYGGNLGIVNLDMSSSGTKMTFDANANLYIGQGKKTSLVFTSSDFIAGTGDNGGFAGFGWNSMYISDGLGVIDARKGLVAAINGDNTVNQTIYASTVVGATSTAAGSEVFLCGGLGENFSNPTADTLVGSANGNTTFYVGRKMGNDVLQKAVGGDKVVFIDTKSTDLAYFTGTSNAFTASFTNGATVKLTAAESITTDNTIAVQFDDVTYRWNGSSLT